VHPIGGRFPGMSVTSMKRTLRDALKRAGALPYIDLAREYLTASGRRQVREDRRVVDDLRRAFRNAPPISRPHAQQPVFLIYGAHGPMAVIAKLPIVLAAQALGYRAWVLLPQLNPLIRLAYRLCRVRDFLYLGDYLSQEPHPLAENLHRSLKTADDLKQVTYKNCRIGMFCLSTLMRWNRMGDPDIRDPATNAKLRGQLNLALQSADAAEAIANKLQPKIVLMNERGYSPYGELFDKVLAQGGECITWNAGHRNDMLVVKRYRPYNTAAHPLSLSAASWERIKRMPWSDAHWRAVRDEIVGSYQSGEWYSECATQLDKSQVDRDEIVRRLDLDPARKTVGLFPHMFWDATFFWGEDLFDNYEQWFVEVLKVAAKNTAVNWIVKIHPANVAKSIRDNFSGEFSEIAAIRRTIGKLPDHITLIPPDSDISTISLFQIMDYCLTVRGTIGIEAGCFGIRVLTAGTGRFDRLGFTRDYATTADYLADLRRLPALPPMTPAEIELARRFAYGVFMARPTKLTANTFRFGDGILAQLESKIRIEAPTIYSSPDVLSLAAWIASGDEDYMTPGFDADAAHALAPAAQKNLVG